MKNQSFKTNINCSGCVARVTNSLNSTVGENKWKVDTENPNKILSVDNPDVSTEDIIEAIKKVGFKIEPLN
ncbi:hypothetical protein Emtol_3179 [Emticicia oligotrophica DSM 17448]|uniref:HMA domain-containing protein n=1 Tax=Emticicia oligotrophica (strain DSM 17448 / CIP 109782 / MTCC 6937 / GPTSA100-15) TaxID=929562 RepID=A0ABN4APF3_EMTOG|nr:heavy-metal-associated domain-containing protein [Emticicia oligotrophica]AFK04312.1 hypothetical protein Emtol_3179 [Emticicia oligotrophica DSM 17448]